MVKWQMRRICLPALGIRLQSVLLWVSYQEGCTAPPSLLCEMPRNYSSLTIKIGIRRRPAAVADKWHAHIRKHASRLRPHDVPLLAIGPCELLLHSCSLLGPICLTVHRHPVRVSAGCRLCVSWTATTDGLTKLGGSLGRQKNGFNKKEERRRVKENIIDVYKQKEKKGRKE
jgi:hypothetical protein